MRWSPALRGVGYTCVLAAAIGGMAAPPVAAQVPSTLDTMRIMSVSDAQAGAIFTVDLYVRNLDTLGAYSVRLRYDPEVMEPVTDTFIIGDDTTITAAVEQLRGSGFEVFAAGIPESGVLTFLASDFDFETGTFFLPGGGAAARMTWRAAPGTAGTTTTLAFENDPVYPASWNVMADLSGVVFTRPILVPGTVTIVGDCLCAWHGDVNLNGIAHEIGDVVLLANVIFLGASMPASPDPFCPVDPGDVDCNGVLDVLDILGMTYIISGDFPWPEGICSPCEDIEGAASTTPGSGEREVEQ